MKKFLKMAALMLLAGALVVGFASCSNGSDDSSSSVANNGSGSGITSTVFKSSDGDKLTFADDGSKKFTFYCAQLSLETEKGTYELSGDFTSGTLTIKRTHELKKDKLWKESAKTITAEISSSSFKFKDSVSETEKTYTKQ